MTVRTKIKKHSDQKYACPKSSIHQCMLIDTQREVHLSFKIIDINRLNKILQYHQCSSVQLLSLVRLLAAPWISARQASLSITNSQGLPKLMSMEFVMPSSHLILCRPLLLLPQIPPSIRVFSKESTLCMKWPKYWSFSFSISPSMDTQDWSPLGWTGWIFLQSKELSESSPTPQFKSISSSALSFLHSPTLTSTHDHWKNHSLD